MILAFIEDLLFLLVIMIVDLCKLIRICIIIKYGLVFIYEDIEV